MSDFPRRPKTAKGAIMALRPDSRQIIIDPDTPTLVFQYNPEALTHLFSPPIREGAVSDGRKPEASSIQELMSITLEFDATDQLEQPDKNKNTVENGLHPALAVLELLLYSQFDTGRPAPLLVFLFGRNRTVPVWLDNVKVVEDAFDPNLNPIRTRIEVVMRVRKFSEFRKGSIGYAVCNGHLKRRRMLSKLLPQGVSMSGLVYQVAANIQ